MNAVLRYLRRVRRSTADPVLLDRVDREIRRGCPCYLHRSQPIEPIACICECDHAPCGHPTRVSGCGGCDPSAIDFEIPERPKHNHDCSLHDCWRWPDVVIPPGVQGGGEPS